MASRMASAATATGAITTEVRVTGCSGASAAVVGLLSSSGLPGKKRLSAQSVVEKKMTSTTAPNSDSADRQAKRQHEPPALLRRPKNAVENFVARHRPASPASPKAGPKSTQTQIMTVSKAVLRPAHV